MDSIGHSYNWRIYGEECVNITTPSIDGHVGELWLSPIFHYVLVISNNFVMSFQPCGNKYILYSTLIS